MKRLFLIAATVATVSLPVSFVAAGLSATSAGAAAPPACAKLSGTISGNFTVTKCTPKSKTNKKATGSSASLATGGGTITWSPSHGTTTLNVSFTQAATNHCTKGGTEYDVTGSVTGGTSTYTASGQSVSAEACASGSGKLSLVKHTKMEL